MRKEPTMNDVFKLALQKTGEIEMAIQIRIDRPRAKKIRLFWSVMFLIMPFMLYAEAKIAYVFLSKIFGDC